MLVIDIETDAGKEHFSKTNETQLTLLFGAQNTSNANTIALSKPVRVSSLRDLLAKVCQRLQTPCSPPEPQPLRPNKKNFTPANQNPASLFEVLYQAKLHKTLLKVQASNAATLYVNGRNGTVAISEKDKLALDEVLTNPVEAMRVSSLELNDMERCVNDAVVSALDACLWKVGVNCSGMEIIAGHSMDKPVKLKAWPSFTRHDFKPVFFRIAATLAKQAVSLNKLKEILQVPQEELVNFYNAAYAVGLIDTNPGAGDNVERSPRPIARPKSVIGRLAERLGFKFS